MLVVPSARKPARPFTQFQLCRYRLTSAGPWCNGIAWLNVGFGTHDVGFIVDAQAGVRVAGVWDYALQDGPLAYMDLAFNTSTL